MVDDPVPGGVLTSGTGTAACTGQLGKTVEFAEGEIFANLAVGVLYTGKYQYVQTIATSFAAPARGLIAFWRDIPNYVVTPDAWADGEIAGIYINALTRGHYGYIQIEGLASVMFSGNQQQATPAIKDLVVQDAGLNTALALADGTAMTAGVQKRVIGIASNLAAPVAGQISAVELFERFLDK
jgi:hypothetical protein